MSELDDTPFYFFKALKIGREYLSTATPGLLKRVVAGERLKDAVQDHQNALEAGARELEQLHEALLSLSQREGQLRAQATEREALATRRAELERLARLAEGVEELRRQVEALERHIEARVQRLVVLSEKTLAHLGRSVRAALELAQQKEQERYEVVAQLRSATKRYKQAETELATLREPLRLYLEADRVVAQALPGAQTARGILDEAERLLHILGQWEDRIRQSRSQIQTILQPMEHAATVMQRELTHVEELRGVDLQQDPDASIRAVSALLHLSIQLAAMLFPPAQLEALASSSTPYALDSLRQRWKRWLEELTAYLAQVMSVAGSLSKIGEAGPMTRSYQQALQELCQQCRQLEALGGATGKPQPENEAQTRVMARLTGGPLGNRLLHLKILSDDVGALSVEVRDETSGS